MRAIFSKISTCFNSCLFYLIYFALIYSFNCKKFNIRPVLSHSLKVFPKCCFKCRVGLLHLGRHFEANSYAIIQNLFKITETPAFYRNDAKLLIIFVIIFLHYALYRYIYYFA